MRDASLPRGPRARRPAPLRSLRSRFRFSEIAQRSFNDGAGVAKDADNLTSFRAGRGTKKIRIFKRTFRWDFKRTFRWVLRVRIWGELS